MSVRRRIIRESERRQLLLGVLRAELCAFPCMCFLFAGGDKYWKLLANFADTDYADKAHRGGSGEKGTWYSASFVRKEYLLAGNGV